LFLFRTTFDKKNVYEFFLELYFQKILTILFKKQRLFAKN